MESVRGKTECKREQSTERARKTLCKFGDAFAGRSFCSLCLAATCLRARVSHRAPVCPLFDFDRQIWADHNLEQSAEPIFNILKERLCDENSTLPRSSSLETAASLK